MWKWKVAGFVLMLVASLSWWAGAEVVEGVYDPLSVDNRRLGVHILHPDEVETAAAFVNAGGKQWGYVTVPIQATNRDFVTWHEFFRKAGELQVIPIVRLATWVHGDTWSIPTDREILYYANFFNHMPWPTKNRYIVVFNEPNHAKEWGMSISPEQYAEKLRYTLQVFKQHHEDFFMLPAAMDWAAPDLEGTMSAGKFLEQMVAADPDLLKDVDGWTAHAYPNPEFSGKPTDTHERSIVSYRREVQFLQQHGREAIPVFITETGWSNQLLSPETIGEYWQTAFEQVWQDDYLATINVWLLRAHDGPFGQFSLLDKQDQPTEVYERLITLDPIKGQPPVNEYVGKVKGVSHLLPATATERVTEPPNWWRRWWQRLLNWLGFGKSEPVFSIAGQAISIEVADDPREMQLGLGFREHLEVDSGMLFVYPRVTRPTFWMKNTLIPLDIIWINNNRVVDITANIPVEDNPDQPTRTYRPSQAVNWVLEVNAGWAKRHSVKVGDEVRWNK
jgi:uncharacterized membrane protein (UPF0127 family)